MQREQERGSPGCMSGPHSLTVRNQKQLWGCPPSGFPGPRGLGLALEHLFLLADQDPSTFVVLPVTSSVYSGFLLPYIFHMHVPLTFSL